MKMETDLLKSLKNKFADSGIEIPFPQRVLTFKDTPNKNC
jgi:small-conductance mechanosensitive channel